MGNFFSGIHCFMHGLAVEATGIGGRQFLKRCIGRNPKPQAYKDYRNIVKAHTKEMNRHACTKFSVVRTYEETAKAHGFQNETLETLQTMDFLDHYHRLLAKKGYKLPKEIFLSEYRLPRCSGLAGETLGNAIIYNPTSVSRLDFRIPIHEEGHLLNPVGNGKMLVDTGVKMFGELLNKLHILPKDRVLCHLSKKEQEILKADLKRAYEGGFFKHNPFENNGKDFLAYAKNAKHKKEIIHQNNKIAKDFRKHPEDYYLPNMQFNRAEFLADYFHLAVRGFKFSPEITAKYLKYGGCEIKEIITPEELQKLEKIRRGICKKSLGDYGYSMAAG